MELLGHVEWNCVELNSQGTEDVESAWTLEALHTSERNQSWLAATKGYPVELP